MRVHIMVRGRVQGVGFRYFTATRARALGLGGSARNLATGGVEVIAEGERSAPEALIRALREGPPGADVRDLEVDWHHAPPRARAFPRRQSRMALTSVVPA